MIPVKAQNEPLDFDKKVRCPGMRYLASLTPNDKPDWKRHGYWKKVSEELWSAYNGICAYYACYFDYVTAHSVDHFVPKSKNPKLAYEWSNYRLCSVGMNSIKRDRQVLDPFTLRPESYFIDFSNGAIYPNPTYDAKYQAECSETAKVLKLDISLNRKRRVQVYNDYINGDLSLAFLAREYPFIHHEIVRQGL